MIIWVTCDKHRLPVELCPRCGTALDMNQRQSDRLGLTLVDRWFRAR